MRDAVLATVIIFLIFEMIWLVLNYLTMLCPMGGSGGEDKGTAIPDEA
jgi:hypothetical protein